MDRTTAYRLALILGMIVTAYGSFTAATVNGAALVFTVLAYLIVRSFSQVDTQETD